MNKAEYLKKLKSLLENVLTKDEIDEISSDYNEYFEAGLSEGKTAEELEKEFGSPEKVAEELLKDRELSFSKSLRCHVKSWRSVWLRIMFFILFLICLISNIELPRDYYVNVYIIDNITMYLIIEIIFVIIMPLLLMLSGLNSLSRIRNKKPARTFDFRIIGISFILVIVTLIALLFSFVSYTFVSHTFVTYTEIHYFHQSVTIFAFLYYSLSAIILIFTCWILFSANLYHKLKWLLFYFSGALMMILHIYNALAHITSLDLLRQNIYRSLFPFAFGSALSFTAILINNARQKITSDRVKYIGWSNEKRHS